MKKSKNKYPTNLLSIFIHWLLSNKFILLFLSLLTVVVYANAFNNEFISDDIFAIQKNINIGKFDFHSLSMTMYFQTVLYDIAYALGGLNPVFFRIQNISFHIGTTLLVFALFTQMIHKRQALFGATIFAVHPVLTESVSWISGFNYSASAFFVILSFLLYILSEKYGKVLFWFSIFLYFLAVTVLEKTIVFPFILLVYEYTNRNITVQVLKKLTAYFAIFVFFVVYFFSSIQTRIAVGQEQAGTTQLFFYDPFIQIPFALGTYIRLFVWSDRLTFFRSIGQIEIWHIVYSISFFLLLVFSFFKHKMVFFWLFFILLTLSPTLTPLYISSSVAERYIYIGTIGFAFIASCVIEKIYSKNGFKYVAVFLFSAIIIALGIRTHIRNNELENEQTFLLASVNADPSSVQAQYNLGFYYMNSKKYKEAIATFSRITQSMPNNPQLYYNIGYSHAQLGNVKTAVDLYDKGLQIDPDYWQIHDRLAGMYTAQGKFDEATKHLNRAIKNNSSNIELQLHKGILYVYMGRKNEAQSIFKQLLVIDPHYADAKIWLERSK